MTHYSRRRVLKLVGVVTLASAAGQLLPVSSLQAAQQDPLQSELKDFTQVSLWLSAETELNPTVAQALLVAFKQTDKEFSRHLSQLKALLQSQPQLLQQDHLVFGQGNEGSEKLAHAILTSWYSGVVGNGFDAVYVTYINNLANQLVSDKLIPPSFSYGPIGSWAQKP